MVTEAAIKVMWPQLSNISRYWSAGKKEQIVTWSLQREPRFWHLDFRSLRHFRLQTSRTVGEFVSHILNMSIINSSWIFFFTLQLLLSVTSANNIVFGDSRNVECIWQWYSPHKGSFTVVQCIKLESLFNNLHSWYHIFRWVYCVPVISAFPSLDI